MDSVIVTQGLSRRFGDTVAVDRLDLSVQTGEVFGFLGPNGAGKTTTVRLLNGVLGANEGRARVLGFDLATQSAEIRRLTGVLTETPSLYDSLTARQNLRLFGDLYGVKEAELPGRIDALLDQFDLGQRGDDRVGTFSKGLRQRLAIARALLHEPPLLFLDEPTAGLDPAAARMVTDLIRQLSHHEGRTIFMCTHNLGEAQRLCDRVGVIDRGLLRATGTPQELASQLWQDVWVQIDLHGEPSAEVAHAVARAPGVRGHTMEGSSLLVELDREDNIPDLVVAISLAGGRIYSVVPQEHSLEDIYFKIQGDGRSERA